jgi:hypothetical protein
MVYMAMGVDQPHRLKVFFPDKTGEHRLFFRPVATRVNNGTFFGFIPQDIGVDLEGVERETVDVEHSLSDEFAAKILENVNWSAVSGRRSAVGSWQLAVGSWQFNNLTNDQ